MMQVRTQQQRNRLGFTLVELLVTVAVIAILASLIMFAMFAAQESAKEAKTKSTIAKINNLIMSRWESYRTRRVPVIPAAGTTPGQAAKIRLDALHELMRLEMPDRWSDIVDPPITAGLARPALSQQYLRRYNAGSSTVSDTFQNAECLFLMITAGQTDDLSGRTLFKDGEIADTDLDGFPEFIDGWNRPIRFLRWAPGFTGDARFQPAGRSEIQTIANPDPFDSRHVYTEQSDRTDSSGFVHLTGSPMIALFPLVYSAGGDGCYGIKSDGTPPIHYAQNNNNPYIDPTSGLIGWTMDLPNEAGFVPNGWVDNIHNHLMGLR